MDQFFNVSHNFLIWIFEFHLLVGWIQEHIIELWDLRLSRYFNSLRQSFYMSFTLSLLSMSQFCIYIYHFLSNYYIFISFWILTFLSSIQRQYVHILFTLASLLFISENAVLKLFPWLLTNALQIFLFS
jgi:hypothetical protein